MTHESYGDSVSVSHKASIFYQKTFFSVKPRGAGRGVIWECVTINASHLISVYSENKRSSVQLLGSFGTKRKFVAARETENDVGKRAPWNERAQTLITSTHTCTHTAV